MCVEAQYMGTNEGVNKRMQLSTRSQREPVPHGAGGLTVRSANASLPPPASCLPPAASAVPTGAWACQQLSQRHKIASELISKSPLVK